MDEQLEKLKKIVQTAIKRKIDIKPNDPLKDIVVSSITFVVILGEIERIFDIEIPEQELDISTNNFKDLESILSLINRVKEMEMS